MFSKLPTPIDVEQRIANRSNQIFQLNYFKLRPQIIIYNKIEVLFY